MSFQPLTAKQVSDLKPEALAASLKEHITAQHQASISGTSPTGDAVNVAPNLTLLEAELMARLKLAAVA